MLFRLYNILQSVVYAICYDAVLVFIFLSADYISAVMSNEVIPIYRRFNNPMTRHTLPVSYEDIIFGYERLLDPHCLVNLSNVYGCYEHWGSPKIAFVGDSSMSRLLYFRYDGHIPTRVRSFLDKSYFIAVGGLKYWTAYDDLNGHIANYDKWTKYGSQWSLFDAKGVVPDYYICKAGSNDCEDVNACFEYLKLWNSYEDYLQQMKLESDLWLTALKPHIRSFFKAILDRNKAAYICYLPIMPRFWWLEETCTFMGHLIYYVLAQLGWELGTNIKCIPCRSLYKNPIRSCANGLEYDCVHLNRWGNEVMIHDVALGLVGNWGATIQGGRWSHRASRSVTPSGMSNKSYRHKPY